MILDSMIDRHLWRSLVIALFLASTTLTLSRWSTLAQMDPVVRSRAIPAAVQIALVVDVTEDGQSSTHFIPVASGTVLSSHGAILTNAHVVDMDAYRKQLGRWEQGAAEQGDHLSFDLNAEEVLILGTNGSEPPTPLFLATVAAQDRDLDLALLQVTADVAGTPIDAQSLSLPSIALGDSDALQLGDPIDILSYPAAGGASLTYTTGVVSGFNFEQGSRAHTWITTDATISGGSSGGTAVNRQGELIGIPTQGSALDCRPGDTNRDGQITADDVGCIPVGGSIGQLRPANLARAWLERAGLLDLIAPSPASTDMGADEQTPASATPIAAAQFQAASTTDTMCVTDALVCGTAGSAGDEPNGTTTVAGSGAIADKCAVSPIYPVGTVLLTKYDGLFQVDADMPGDWLLPADSVVRILGPYVENGACDLWPVEVVSVRAGGPQVLVGKQGLLTETVF
jgi:S1-C subfamily serine protease